MIESLFDRNDLQTLSPRASGYVVLKPKAFTLNILGQDL